MFQGSINGVSRKIEGCSNRLLSGFQGCLKEFQWVLREVLKVFHGSFKGVSMKFSRCFKEN